MAKKRSTINWHKKHVPTGWGVAMLSFLLLVTVILIPAVKQQQVSESDAATAISTSTQCISYNTSGKCTLYQKTTTTVNTNSPCVGYNTSGKCVQYQNTTQNTSTYVPSNGSTNKTAPQKQNGTTTINYGQSTACKKLGGTCQSYASKKSGGNFHAGLCPGPTSWQCFVPSSSKATTGGSVSSTSACAKIGGTCMSTSAHTNGVGGSYHPGYCPGSSTKQCWVPGSSTSRTTTGRSSPQGCTAPNHLTNGFCCPSGKVGDTQSGECLPPNTHVSNGIICPLGSQGNVQTGTCVICPAGKMLVNKQGVGEICM